MILLPSILLVPLPAALLLSRTILVTATRLLEVGVLMSVRLPAVLLPRPANMDVTLNVIRFSAAEAFPLSLKEHITELETVRLTVVFHVLSTTPNHVADHAFLCGLTTAKEMLGVL